MTNIHGFSSPFYDNCLKNKMAILDLFGPHWQVARKKFESLSGELLGRVAKQRDHEAQLPYCSQRPPG
jgi:hypothetical protein